MLQTCFSFFCLQCSLFSVSFKLSCKIPFWSLSTSGGCIQFQQTALPKNNYWQQPRQRERRQAEALLAAMLGKKHRNMHKLTALLSCHVNQNQVVKTAERLQCNRAASVMKMFVSSTLFITDGFYNIPQLQMHWFCMLWQAQKIECFETDYGNCLLVGSG